MNDKLKSQIKRQISQAKIVSFDIFDTLLVRPYVKPTDLFKHMEKMDQILKQRYSLQMILSVGIVKVLL